MEKLGQGIQIVLSGFSGAGKGTVVKALLGKYDDYAISISATTRKPRAGEVEGIHYFYKTREEFEVMIAGNQLMEYANYVGNYYGTPSEYVELQKQKGKDVILEIELQGAMQIKKNYPETSMIFLTPPNAEELKRRLTKRGTEDKNVIASRLARAYEESASMEDYDYIVINDTVEECVEQIHTIIQAECHKTFRNREVCADMRQQLKTFSRGE